MRTVVDLTHTIREEMPVYPGTEPPRLREGTSYSESGYRETLLHLFSHTGTHMDAPAHLFEDRTTLDAFPVSQFVGTALCIDCTDVPAGGRIAMERIDCRRPEADAADFLLFHTGWSAWWGDERYFEGYPCITSEVARYVLDTGKKGVGFDTIGIDPVEDEELVLHRTLFETGDVVVVENLAHLDQVGPGPFSFAALPLKYVCADGAPVRAIAVLES